MVLGLALALAPFIGGCHKKAPPPPPAARPAAQTFNPFANLPPISCPAPETFAPLAGPGRALRTDCVVFVQGLYWVAAALTYDETTGKNPRFHYLAGSPGSHTIVFDIDPLPVAQVEELIHKSAVIGVQIRRTRNDIALVRLGVTGKPAADKPDRKEVGVLLQLVAHKPPLLVWMGPGDEIASRPDGCVTEQTIDYELLFHNQLERFVINKAHRPAGAAGAPCTAGPSTQEGVGYKALALKAPHPLTPDAPTDATLPPKTPPVPKH